MQCPLEPTPCRNDRIPLQLSPEVNRTSFCARIKVELVCRAMQQASELLEIAKIETVHGGSALYGISYAAIRSVASGGKVCLVALDTSGAATLFNDDRIEAAFAYVVPPSLAEMERRLRARLKEAPSTIERRVEWARVEVRCPTPTCYFLCKMLKLVFR